MCKLYIYTANTLSAMSYDPLEPVGETSENTNVKIGRGVSVHCLHYHIPHAYTQLLLATSKRSGIWRSIVAIEDGVQYTHYSWEDKDSLVTGVPLYVISCVYLVYMYVVLHI